MDKSALAAKHLILRSGVDVGDLCMDKVAEAASKSPSFLYDLLNQPPILTTKEGSSSALFDTFSSPAVTRLRRALGPRALGFFRVYAILKDYHEDAILPTDEDDLYTLFRIASSRLHREITDKGLEKAFRVNVQRLQPLIRRVSERWDSSPGVYSQINTIYLDTIRLVTQHYGIYLRSRGRGYPAWATFRQMSKKEKEVEELRDSNPELYDKVQEEKELRKKIDTAISRKIKEDGYQPEKKRVFDSVVMVGKDERGRRTGLVGGTSSDGPNRWHAPDVSTAALQALGSGLRVDVTINNRSIRVVDVDEANQTLILADDVRGGVGEYSISVTEELVYNNDGSVVPVEEFVKARKRERETLKRLSRIFPEDLDDLRSYSDMEELDLLLEGREISYAALSDDVAKQKSVTRIYPVAEINGERVIAEGRFKGMILDDMINRAGRMIEGTAYDLDPKLGRPIALETQKGGEFQVDLPANREPYLTVNPEGRLYLKMPSTRDYTVLRNEMRDLSKISLDVTYVDKTRNSVFTFGPEEFIAVRDALGSVAMSESASKLVQEHFKELAKHDLDNLPADLDEYSAEALGGFKPDVKLYTRQKQGLAWVENRGGSGLQAAGTGVGKSVMAISYIQNLKATGELEEGSKVLYVCPSSLKENLPKEARVFLKDPALFDASVDIMSYHQFSSGPEDIMDDYVAVIFDEAQRLASETSARARNAMRYHPRKLLLTGSPMESDITDVRILVAIADNEELFGADLRREVKNFAERYCERIGGRSVAVKKDPGVNKMMQEWVKEHMFYADKTDIEEYDLPTLTKEVETLTLPPEIETEYREALLEVKEVLDGMVSRYKFLDPEAKDGAINSAKVALKGAFKRINTVANMPPGQRPPKAVESEKIIRNRIESGGRSLLWTDDPDFAEAVVADLSESLPGTDHAVALSDSIQIWRSGRLLKRYTSRKYEFDGQSYAASSWRMAVVEHVIKPNPRIVSAVMTSTYTTGFNLQEFDTIIHLDRDSWSAENMQQRSARAWRQGQEAPCREITLDTVFASPTDDFDVTLDEVQALVQNMEEELFQKVIVDSQKAALGKEYFEMDQLLASEVDVDRKLAELYLSPYASNVADYDGTNAFRERN